VSTVIFGATGSGKTTALMRQYQEWVHGGARTDQVLVLTAGAAHSSWWRQNVHLQAHGPIEAHSFFGFIQRELNLHWGLVQSTVPLLQAWIRPEFLNVEVANHLMRGLVEPVAAEFAGVLKATPQRLAIQIAGNLSTVSAAAGLSAGAMAERLAASARVDKAPLFERVAGLLESFRQTCLRAGLLDYGLSLQLFTGVLAANPVYLDHLRGRYRYLLVDDLDESVPAEQDFLAAIAGHMEQSVYALGTDGGHRTFMGADLPGAQERLVLGAERVSLAGSHTCSADMFAFGEAVWQRVMGAGGTRRFSGIVSERLAADLRGDMINQVVKSVADLVSRGAAPGEIAILVPRVEQALEATARRVLGESGLTVQNLSLSRRLVDDAYARVLITLAGLVHPQWRIPRDTAGSFANAMQLLLNLDPIRASVLGDAVWRMGDLPNLDESGLRRRIGFASAEAYEHLQAWVLGARERGEWATDAFAQAAITELLAPLIGTPEPERLHACQQLLGSANRFRMAMLRFGPGAYGSEYVKMLTEGTVAADPLEAYEPAADAVTLATPFAYLTSRLTSRFQIWVDLSSSGWYPSDVKELANPHVLARTWPAGERWTDNRNNRVRQEGAARTARALIRRCSGRLILAECSLSAWGQEQSGGLAEAFSDLVWERGRAT